MYGNGICLNRFNCADLQQARDRRKTLERGVKEARKKAKGEGGGGGFMAALKKMTSTKQKKEEEEKEARPLIKARVRI